MKQKRFQYLLDLEGSDLARWSAEERAAARDLLARSALAREAHARATQLDNLLAMEKAADPSPDTVARVLAAVARLPDQASKPAPRVAQEPLWRWRSSVAWLAASAALGLIVGVYGGGTGTVGDGLGSLLTAALAPAIFGS